MSDENTTSTEALDPYADNPDVVLREHTYDGIHEYDQKLPNWWLWTLYIFIIWFVVHWMLYYQFKLFRSDDERVGAEIAEIERRKDAQLEELLGSMDDAALWKMSRDQKVVADGKAAYDTICFTCHAPDLRGSATGLPQHIGLPLNDAEWKYSAEPLGIFDIVMNGSPPPEPAAPGEAAPLPTALMPPHKHMGGVKVAKIVAYILSHHEQPAAAEAEVEPDA